MVPNECRSTIPNSGMLPILKVATALTSQLQFFINKSIPSLETIKKQLTFEGRGVIVPQVWRPGAQRGSRRANWLTLHNTIGRLHNLRRPNSQHQWPFPSISRRVWMPLPRIPIWSSLAIVAIDSVGFCKVVLGCGTRRFHRGIVLLGRFMV